MRKNKHTTCYYHLEILIISCPAMQADSEIGTDISLAPVMKIASKSAVSQNVTFSQNNVFDPRRIQVVSFGNPRAFIYKSFLSTAECDFLIVSWSHSSVDIKEYFFDNRAQEKPRNSSRDVCLYPTNWNTRSQACTNPGWWTQTVEIAYIVKFVPRPAHLSHQVSCGHASSGYLISPLTCALDMMLKISCFRNESNGAKNRKSHSHLESNSTFAWRAYSSIEISSWPRVPSTL